MKAETGSESTPKNFWEFYKKEIFPKIQEIDIFLKSIDEPIRIETAAKALSISENEIRNIMKQKNLSEINKPNFILIMENGTSNICQLFKREVECGSPFVYTRENISYIYNLSIETVNTACDSLGIKEATAYTLPLLFSQINLP